MVVVKTFHSLLLVCVWISSVRRQRTCKEVLFRHPAPKLFLVIVTIHLIVIFTMIEWTVSSFSMGKIYVLRASFSKNFVQNTDMNFFSTKDHDKLAKSILRHKFPSKYKPNRFFNANFSPYISPFKGAFEKYKPRALFSDFAIFYLYN